jgi:hypothetical protein
MTEKKRRGDFSLVNIIHLKKKERERERERDKWKKKKKTKQKNKKKKKKTKQNKTKQNKTFKEVSSPQPYRKRQIVSKNGEKDCTCIRSTANLECLSVTAGRKSGNDEHG